MARKLFSALFCLILALTFNAQETPIVKKIAHPEPVTDFEVLPFCFGDTTYFKNLTIRADDFYWSIFELNPNGTDTTYKSVFSAVDSNIKFKFPLKGLYKVVLVGDNGHTVAKSRFISVDSKPVAAFDYDQCTGKFTNLSVCASKYKWDFGDGTYSSGISPIHFYNSTNSYAVKLKVYSATDSAFLEKTLAITALNNTTLNPEFNLTVRRDHVDFKAVDSTSGNFTTFQWSFGDLAVYTLKGDAGRKVRHSFGAKDTSYLVFLILKSGCATAFSSKSVFIPDSTPVEKTKIYPNPVSNSVLRLEIQDKANLKGIYLTNCLGAPVGNFGIQETIKGYDLFLYELNQGVYFINLHYTSGYKAHRILKQ